MSEGRYFGNWSNWEDMAKDLHERIYDKDRREYKVPVVPEGFPTDKEIVFAVYGTPSYEGYAMIVYQRDDKLFEINGSHCSCFGLDESMGAPEETSLGALAMRELDPYHEYGDDAIARFNELFKPSTDSMGK